MGTSGGQTVGGTASDGPLVPTSQEAAAAGSDTPQPPLQLPPGAPGSAQLGPDSSVPECPVCRMELQGQGEIQVFSCGHWVCDECSASLWTKADAACPFCRTKVTAASSFRVALSSGGAAGGPDTEVDPPEGPQVLQMKVSRAAGGPTGRGRAAAHWQGKKDIQGCS
jgi:hypothetical protein